MNLQSVSIRGKQKVLPSIPVGDTAVVIVKGGLLKKGAIHDEFWLRSADIPAIEVITDKLRASLDKPDIFTFAQKVPDTVPRYTYHMELENLAVLRFASYADWHDAQVERSVRKHIRKSEKEGVRVEAVGFTDDFVGGVHSIYNESPVRQGRRFWHFGKSLTTVKSENSSYLERSIFIGAYFEAELIGFLKLVLDGDVAHIMQILSKKNHFAKRPNNALLSKAVELCASSGVSFLTYGTYTSGRREKSGLSDFKTSNGFHKVDVPRYFLPLTRKGMFFLKLGLHRGIASLIPGNLWSLATNIREKMYNLRS
jgi:hypothetical protein